MHHKVSYIIISPTSNDVTMYDIPLHSTYLYCDSATLLGPLRTVHVEITLFLVKFDKVLHVQ